MPEEYTFLLYKSNSRESRTDFPGKWEWQNRRDPGKSGTGNPRNETLGKTPFSLLWFLWQDEGCVDGKTFFDLIRQVGLDIDFENGRTGQGISDLSYYGLLRPSLLQ
jgi:hypothetical protein